MSAQEQPSAADESTITLKIPPWAAWTAIILWIYTMCITGADIIWHMTGHWCQ